MNKELEQVYQFNKLGKQNLATEPRLIPTEDFISQINLIREELSETIDAGLNNNPVEILDGMIDIAYVLFGLVNKLGMQKEFIEGFQKVHENNMTKVIDTEGNIIVQFNKAGKIIKPEGFKPVNLQEAFPYLLELKH